MKNVKSKKLYYNILEPSKVNLLKTFTSYKFMNLFWIVVIILYLFNFHFIKINIYITLLVYVSI